MLLRTKVLDYLNEKLPDLWIDRHGIITQFLHFPDIALLDFFLCEIFEEHEQEITQITSPKQKLASLKIKID